MAGAFFQDAKSDLHVVKGIVSDEKGQPLPGVSITLKGAGAKGVTDAKGNYNVRLTAGTGTLVFTFIGYEKTEVAIAGKGSIDVIMRPSSSTVDEVLVIGYGTQKKREVTSSISSMKGAEIEKYNINSFQSALQGQLPGVEMYESSGVPGAAVNIRIRGLNTINGSAGPLYVVDGIPVLSGGGGDGDAPITNDLGMGGTQTNIMADINPADIESIEVLKDAASAAIYGARGSGGVILITTKRAKAGKTTFNLSLVNGITELSRERDLLNGPQLLTIMDEAYRNSFYSNPANAGLPLPATPLPAIKNLDRGMADSTDIDYLRQIMRKGIYREITLSAMNGTDKTKFYLSGTYKRTVGNIRGSDMNQFNFRINVDHNLSKYVRLGASMAPSLNSENRLGSGSVISAGGYGAAVSTNLPIYPLFNPDGTYFNPWTNPLAFLDRDLYYNNSKRIRLTGAAYFEADLLPGLKSRTNVQREDVNQVGRSFIDGLLRLRSTTGGSAISPFADDQLGRAAQQNSFGWITSLESYFTYDKAFGRHHKLNAVLGMRFSETDTRYEAMYGENFPNRHLLYPSQAAFIDVGFQTGAVGEPSANLGYFFRANYKYREKYFLSLIVNRDGSSRFGRNMRYGTFPAVSAGWILSDEPFLRGMPVFDLIKLRASAGLTGNAQGISNLAAIPSWGTSLNTSGYMGTATSNPARPGNKNLHWEKGVKYDAGIDLALLKNRIEATVDVYHYTTRDMLLSIPTGTTYGYGVSTNAQTFLENRGSLINKGLEFSISTLNLTGAFSWRTSFNISFNQTEIVSLGGLSPETVSGGGGDVRLYTDHVGPVYNLIEWVGVDPVTGGELILDKNDKVVLANGLNAQELADARRPQFDRLPSPKFYGGISNNFAYKGLSLSLFFSYRLGHHILDAGERVASYVGNLNYANGSTFINIGNLSAKVLDRWQQPGQETDVPRMYYNDPDNDKLRLSNTTRFLSDASFIRLKNAQLAYAIPPKVSARLRLKQARVFVTGQNLLLFTRFKGVDPEAANIPGSNDYRDRNLSYGIIQNVVPQSRSYTIGLNVGF
jgi:TonB-linked SusC/RagA family outer membrane protein